MLRAIEMDRTRNLMYVERMKALPCKANAKKDSRTPFFTPNFREWSGETNELWFLQETGGQFQEKPPGLGTTPSLISPEIGVQGYLRR